MADPHPNFIVQGLLRQGYAAADLLPAYPGLDAAGLERIWLDTALSQDRPVLPYGLLGIVPCRSATFNHRAPGYRLSGTEQPWPPVAGKPTVFCFGGSTVLGFNLADHQTVPAALQAELARLGADAQVYNFGSNSWTCRHGMLALLTLLDQGFKPDVAVFLDGFNDCQYALGNPGLVKLLDELYQSEKRRRRKGLLAAVWDYARSRLAEGKALPNAFSWRLPEEFRRFEPYFKPEAIDAALQAETVPPASEDDKALAALVWERYLDSVALARAACGRHGVTPLFFWQPVALHRVKPASRLGERVFHVFPNGVLAGPVYRGVEALGFPGRPDCVHDLGALAEGFDGPAYIDTCHYSPAFARHVAAAMAARVAPVLGGVA